MKWFSGQSSVADAKANQTRLRCSSDGFIVTRIIRSSWRSGWPLRNIHISKWQWIFSFLRRLFISAITNRSFTGLYCIYIWVAWWMSYKKQKLLTIREYPSSSPDFGGVRIAHFLAFCLVLGFVCLRHVSCVSNVSSVLGVQCFQCLWIVHSWLCLQFPLTFIYLQLLTYILVVNVL